MKKPFYSLILLFALTFFASFAHAQTTVTGTVAGITGPINSGTFVRFRLRNFAGFVPHLTGSGACAGGAVAQTILPNTIPTSNGTFSIANFCGNDAITPLNTFYTVEYWVNGLLTSSANYIITGLSYNLDTAAPIIVPVAPAQIPIVGLYQGTPLIPGDCPQAATSSTIVDSGVPCGNLINTGVFQKPKVSDALQYVSPNGSDANDGLSWGTAKLTIMAGYDALPSSGGTIYISGNSQCTSTAGQGIWIMGSTDPNFGVIPAGWRAMKSGAVSFQGVSATQAGQNAIYGWATLVSCGNSTNYGVWLSGTVGVTISHLRMISKGIRVSIDSNGSRANNSNLESNTVFDHNSLRVDCATCGPTMDIGGGQTWLHVTDNELENNGRANGVLASSNLASNIFVSNGNAGSNLGLMYFDHNFFTGGGGLRFDASSSVTSSFYASHTLMEGSSTCQPTFEVINTGTFTAHIDLEGGVSDCTAIPQFVKVAAGNDPCATSVTGLNQAGQVPSLEGPLTVGDTNCTPSTPSGGISVSDNGVPASGVTPAAKWQRGGIAGLPSPQIDNTRRSFTPSFVRFTNLAAQNPANWTVNLGTGESLTQIQGPGDPAGITNAATLTCTANGGQGGCDYLAYNNNLTLAAGDYIYIGVWTQPASTAGFANSTAGAFTAPIGLEQVSNPSTIRLVSVGPVSGGSGGQGLFVIPYYQTDGNWQWIWGLFKVTGPSGALAQFKLHMAFRAGFPINAYAPMFVRIPASSLALVAAPTFSSASETGNIETFITTGNHNLSIGMPVTISSCSISGYNGEFVLANTITATSFTLFNNTTGLGAPTGCVITPGNDSEATDWASTVSSYGDTCTVRTICGLRGINAALNVISGTQTLPSSAILSVACSAFSTSAAGALATDRIAWAYATTPTTADGLLILNASVASGSVNWKLCNPTASSQTPTGLVVNWEIIR